MTYPGNGRSRRATASAAVLAVNTSSLCVGAGETREVSAPDELKRQGTKSGSRTSATARDPLALRGSPTCCTYRRAGTGHLHCGCMEHAVQAPQRARPDAQALRLRRLRRAGAHVRTRTPHGAAQQQQEEEPQAHERQRGGDQTQTLLTSSLRGRVAWRVCPGLVCRFGALADAACASHLVDNSRTPS